MRHTTAVLVLLVCGALCAAAPEASAELSLTLSTHKAEFALGEPIVVEATLRCSNAPARISGRLDPGYTYTSYFVRGPDGKEQLFEPLAHIESVPTERTLQPGESLQASAKLFFGARGWTFGIPGGYQVRAVFLGAIQPPGDVSSNLLSLTVRAPASTDEQEQARLIMGEEQGKFLIWEGGDHLTQGVQALTTLADRYPDSPHGSYANFALGISYSRPFKNFKTNVFRPANLELARTHLGKVRLPLLAPSLRTRLQQLTPALRLQLPGTQ